MKRIAAIFLIIIIACVLCSCKKEDEGPMAETMKQDITIALREKNPQAILQSMETEKNRTDKDVYEETLKLTAESTYAKWKYEIDIQYIKYKQGWILDSIQWITEKYEIVRMPTMENMINLLQTTMPKAVNYEGELERMFPDSQHTYGYDNTTGTIQLCWLGNEEYFSNCIPYFVSTWDYNTEMDNWSIQEYNEIRITP